MKKCVEGDPDRQNGLRFHFNDTVSIDRFGGFDFPVGIYKSKGDRGTFFGSVEREFKEYWALDGSPPARNCDEALRGQSLLTLAASAINGYYFIDLLDYMEHGLE